MKCPFCGGERSRVLDTRLVEGGCSIRRRRQCVHCGMRFTTYERYSKAPLTVIKKNNRREPFDREKLKKGIMLACSKRSVSPEAIEEMVRSIEKELHRRTYREISTKELGDLVVRRLKDLDEIAYMRFISVYKEFNAVEEFVKEVKKIKDVYESHIHN